MGHSNLIIKKKYRLDRNLLDPSLAPTIGAL
jgi:hypothetical protein